MKKRQTKASKIKWTASSNGQFCRCARCGMWHDQDRAGPDTWLVVGPPDDPDSYVLCSRCYIAIMRRRPQFLDLETFLTLLPARWPRRGRKDQ